MSVLTPPLPTQAAAPAPSAHSAPLTRADRCDACGAAAYARATKDGRSLLFCGHHTRKHEDALVTSGFAIYSEVARLLAEHGPGQGPGASA